MSLCSASNPFNIPQSYEKVGVVFFFFTFFTHIFTFLKRGKISIYLYIYYINFLKNDKYLKKREKESKKSLYQR